MSYTKSDVEWARWIAWELEKAGYSCVFQDRDFSPGGNFIQQMRRAMRESRQTIAIVSPDYLRSDYCTAELNSVLFSDPNGEFGKLVPVLVKATPPSDLMAGRVSINLVGKSSREVRQALRDGVAASRMGLTGAAGRKPFLKKPDFPGKGNQPRQEGGSHPQIGAATAGESLSVLRLMFVASEASSGLDLRGQFRLLKEAVRKGSLGRRIKLSPIYDVTNRSLFPAINRFRPHVFHFSGKQDGNEILVKSADGGVTTISSRALGGIFESLDRELRLVIIDTCYSLPCAQTISEHVDCAIGVKSFIYEEDSNVFYESFYGALASGRSIHDSHAQASSTLRLQRTPQSQIPRLICRRGTATARIPLLQSAG